MTVHITFNNMKHSDAVSEHVEELFQELTRITDNKFPFHISLSKENETYTVGIKCSFLHKPLSSKSSHDNLYKAISKCVNAMKVQVVRKSEKTKRVKENHKHEVE